MHTPALAGVGNIKLPDNALADAAPAVSKKPAKGSGGGSAVPVPEPKMAKNGLMYQSNPKHTPGVNGTNPMAGIEPRNSFNLFEDSVSITLKNDPYHKHRYTVDSNGDIHRFSPDNTGNYHWSGSTADKNNKLRVDQNIKSQLSKITGRKIK